MRTRLIGAFPGVLAVKGMSMMTSSLPAWAALAVAAGAALSGCDAGPDILFVADASPVHMLQLTDAQGECASQRRVCYLTSWDGETSLGCWIREQGSIHARFPDQEERVIPVGDFRATALASYSPASGEWPAETK